ncbi:MAG: SDR family NAD(P)-dependent oxidoreductase [Francisellaceae bacterium]|jgi:NAD(P)-dependent dehydrogenase (short-subunit alcohol dehydrogenase family)|nr:SDR family NAD(P)-dependent oxidoreductase [Francisellaceae bacterium]MBT6208078.1 SDR family NAD(P)-dependent oxidoreductase [Francisellaceae bacterium]MBT6538784.1 SDR family NAD(P)-dependent oxidoreductase [Francisellaceae bacterium]
MELNELTVMVTGGAQGLGLATAKHLTEQGAQLILLDLSEEQLAENADELGARYFVADVTDEARIGEIFTQLADESHVPRVCVNCAGIVLAMKMLSSQGDMEPSSFRKVIEVNLIGTYNIMFNAAKCMKDLEPINDDNEHGLIINTSSVAAFEGQIGQVAYSASKGGVAALTLPAARELARHGIRVNTIAPGLMNTPMLASLPDAAKENLIATTVFPKRLGHPSEFAMLCEQVIRNPLLNGTTIRLDGGVRLTAK